MKYATRQMKSSRATESGFTCGRTERDAVIGQKGRHAGRASARWAGGIGPSAPSGIGRGKVIKGRLTVRFTVRPLGAGDSLRGTRPGPSRSHEQDIWKNAFGGGNLRF